MSDTPIPVSGYTAYYDGQRNGDKVTTGFLPVVAILWAGGADPGTAMVLNHRGQLVPVGDASLRGRFVFVAPTPERSGCMCS